MEIILLKEVEKIGKAGQVLKVSDGFARNFLLPQGLAVVSTQKNLKRIELQNQIKERGAQKKKKEAEELAGKIKGLSCTVAVETNENDKLYGSVTESDVSLALEVEGFKIDQKDIVLEKPIEELGIFDIEIKLHPEVSTKIKLWVTKK